jgi:hypothetical protein
MTNAAPLQTMSGATAAAGYVLVVQLAGGDAPPLLRILALVCFGFSVPVSTYYYIRPLPLHLVKTDRFARFQITLFSSAILLFVLGMALLLLGIHSSIGVSFIFALLLLLIVFRSQ